MPGRATPQVPAEAAAASTNHNQQSHAVSLFITDMLAASIGQGNGVTMVATPFQ
jgi:uncharacterized protein YoaH (UPF0181 family)